MGAELRGGGPEDARDYKMTRQEYQTRQFLERSSQSAASRRHAVQNPAWGLV